MFILSFSKVKRTYSLRIDINSVPHLRPILFYHYQNLHEFDEVMVLLHGALFTLLGIRSETTNYSMFHLAWTTFKFNWNQLGTVSAYVM